jgi:PAS domain S-box-containing protein
MPITGTVPMDDQALLALLPDAVFALDADGRISRWTRSAEHIYGFTSAEARGRGVDDLLRSHLPHPLPELLSIVASAGSWRGMAIQRTKSGRATSVESRWTAHCDEHGELRGVLAVDRAVSAAHDGQGPGLQSRTAGISHEFNNLLMIVINYAKLIDDQLERMQQAPSDPCVASLRTDIGQIQTAAARAVRLNRQLSAFSKHAWA